MIAEDEAETKEEEALWREAKARALATDAEDAKHAAMSALASTISTNPPAEKGADLVKQLLAEDKHEVRTPGVTISETPTSTVIVHEMMEVTSTLNTARVTTFSTAEITSAAPETLGDEPSDGIVRQIATVETEPVRRPPPGAIPPDDRPEARKGEISTPRPKRATSQPRSSEPSILVGDLAAAQTAISAVVAAQAAAPASPDIAAPAAERAIAEVRKDAVTPFSDTEEEFFRAGQGHTGKVPLIAPESFDDLDEDYKPVGFWDRLRGKKPTK